MESKCSLIGVSTKDNNYKEKISQNIGLRKFVWINNCLFSTTSHENINDNILTIWDIRKGNNEIYSIIIRSCKNSTSFEIVNQTLIREKNIHLYV